MREIEIRGTRLTRGVWCLTCEHAEQFGRMASEYFAGNTHGLILNA